MFSQSFEQSLGHYSLDNVVETSQITRDYIAQTSGESGSAYSLGDFDPSLEGMLTKAPAAINVALFRPYLWEARKPIIFFNALEAALLLIITLRVVFSLGPIKLWQGISASPNIQFCVIFTLVFAFAVGISTYNFGSLSRYRIPCLPLFGLALVLLFYRYNPPEKKILGPI
jgi:hypothetical protein